MPQMRTMLVCQVCGRTSPRPASHWLDEPHRSYPGVHVVRCPQHWSEWALRHTKAGRTKVMRGLMQDALSQPEPAMPPWLDPFPTTERP